jgi:hypothetical protein
MCYTRNRLVVSPLGKCPCGCGEKLEMADAFEQANADNTGTEVAMIFGCFEVDFYDALVPVNEPMSFRSYPGGIVYYSAKMLRDL